MTIDEAIEFCNEKSKNIKLRTDPSTFESISAYLQELKEFRANRADTIDEFTRQAFDAEVTDGFGNKEIRFFVDVTEIIHLRSRRNES